MAYMSSALHMAFLGLATEKKSMFFDFEANENEGGSCMPDNYLALSCILHFRPN
jgi:hypothetical protein